jgi:hypothetical protein
MEKHYNNLWKPISSYFDCPVTGQMNVLDKYIKTWDKLANWRKIVSVPVKHYYYNTGNTAYSRSESFVLYQGKMVVGIYVIRYRNDGYGTMILKWNGSYDEWESYSTFREAEDLRKVME